jgi:hypothetical protein
MGFEAPKQPSQEDMAKKEKLKEEGNAVANAVDFCESGEYEKALEIAKKLESSNKTWDRNIQENVIARMIENGKIDEAIGIAYNSKYENCLGVASRYLAKVGEKEKALSMVNEMNDPERKIYFLQLIIKDSIEKERKAEEKKSEEKNNWYVGAKENPDGSLDLSHALGFKPEKKTKEQTESVAEKPKETKESLEQEKLFNQQIENNTYAEARSLQTGVAFFLDSLDRNETLENYKIELGEILRLNDIEYQKDKNIKIPEQNKTVLEPLLKLRKELDHWATFTQPQVKLFREKFVKYLQETFGIEESRAKQGEKYEKRGQQAVRTEETNDKSMDYIIKNPIASGYKINEKLWDYYKDKFYKENHQRNEELKNIKKTVSPDEFDKIYDEYSKWNRSYSFSQTIRPARVVIYQYKE